MANSQYSSKINNAITDYLDSRYMSFYIAYKQMNASECELVRDIFKKLFIFDDLISVIDAIRNDLNYVVQLSDTFVIDLLFPHRRNVLDRSYSDELFKVEPDVFFEFYHSLKVLYDSSELENIKAYKESVGRKTAAELFIERQKMLIGEGKQVPDQSEIIEKVPFSLHGDILRHYGMTADNYSQCQYQITQKFVRFIRRELMPLDSVDLSVFKPSCQKIISNIPKDELLDIMRQNEMTFRQFQKLYHFLECSLGMFNPSDHETINDMLAVKGDDADVFIMFDKGSYCAYHIKHDRRIFNTISVVKDLAKQINYLSSYFRHQELFNQMFRQLGVLESGHPLEFGVCIPNAYSVACLKHYNVATEYAKKNLVTALTDDQWNPQSINSFLDVECIDNINHVYCELLQYATQDQYNHIKAKLRELMHVFVYDNSAQNGESHQLAVYRAIVSDETRAVTEQLFEQEDKDYFYRQKFGVWLRIQMMYIWCVSKIKNLIKDWFPSEKSGNVSPLNPGNPIASSMLGSCRVTGDCAQELKEESEDDYRSTSGNKP